MKITAEDDVRMLKALEGVKPKRGNGRVIAKVVMRNHWELISQKLEEGFTHAQIRKILKDAFGIEITHDTVRKYICDIRNEFNTSESSIETKAQTSFPQQKRESKKPLGRNTKTLPTVKTTDEGTQPVTRFNRYAKTHDLENKFNL